MNTSHPVALVTGGGRRIGAAICKRLHQSGFNIIVHYCRSAESAQKLAKELNDARADSAVIYCADLNDMSQAATLADFARTTWGRLDALVNNASSFYPTPLERACEEDWDNLLNSNLKAPYFLCQALVKELTRQQGTIVNLADIFSERPMPNHSIYSIAKAGNRMLTQSLALELAPSVRVNGVAPGAILWPEDAEGNEKVTPEKLAAIPLGRLGGAESIADTVLFLINGSPYMTGQIIRVDGGRSLMQ
jgi:pteridine reductase